MQKLLTRENVQIVDKVSDGIEAIRKSIEPLIKTNCCEARYVDGIIENMNKFGPYFILCEDLALLHARSDQGAIKTQIAVTRLNEPVVFRDKGVGVRVIVGLVATDSYSHMKAIKALNLLFKDEEKSKRVIETNSEDEIFNIFNEALDV